MVLINIRHVLLLTLLYTTVTCVEPKLIKTKVAILGAGAAGISSAKRLSELGIDDFVIVEAQTFVGGRVQHADFGTNSKIELGANWIYGKGKNPVHAMAKKYKLKTAPSSKSNVIFFNHKEGLMKDQTEGINVYNEFESVKDKLIDYSAKRMKHQQVDLSSRSALSLLGWKPNTPIKSAVEYFNIDWEFSEPAEMCSLDYATGTVNTVTYPLGDEFVTDARGFNHILKSESRQFLSSNDTRLMLNALVTKVIYDDSKVIIHIKGGDVVQADYAICTFSLGVLQSDDLVQFFPPFPEWKREALLSFHMTTYTKIFLKFDTKFWGDWQFALYTTNATQHGGYYTVWQNLNAPGYLSSKLDNILMVTTTDKESHRIERMTDAEVLKEIMVVLRQMFPRLEIKEPSSILVPRWQSNPLFRGSYSNWPIGALKKHHMNMRAPLNNRLWFAGEAMSADYYGFLHGAWLEGKTAAESVYRCTSSHSACPRYKQYEYIRGCDRMMESTFTEKRLGIKNESKNGIKNPRLLLQQASYS